MESTGGNSPFVFNPHVGGFMNPQATVEAMQLEKGSTVADFGSGSGYLTIPIARVIGGQGQVYAIDILEGPLESVESKAKLENLRNIETKRANLEVIGSTEIPDQTVDAVVMSNILFQTQDHSGLFAEAKRVLKHDGKAIVVEWSPDRAPVQLGKNAMSKEQMTKHFQENGWTLTEEFAVSDSHYGLKFTKNAE